MIASAGPIPMPAKTEAHMKLLYVVALPCQTDEIKQTIVLHMSTVRWPKFMEIGIQRKLENPAMRTVVPVYISAR